MDPLNLLQRLATGGAATPERDELVAQHNKLRESMLRDFPQLKSYLKTTSSVHTKPVSRASQPRPFGQLSPIAVRNLQPGTTHRGRVLRGKLIVDPILLTSIATLLEDEQGTVVRLYVYNMLPAKLTGLAGLHAAAAALPNGAAVAIIEPFFKLCADGGMGVRVDDPTEVVLLDSLAPSDAASLQAEGRTHFQAARHAEAADCYSRALARMPDGDAEGSSLLVTLLLNLSAAHLKLGNCTAALYGGMTAAAVQPGSSKVHFRCAQALAGLVGGLGRGARQQAGVEGGREGLECAAVCALHSCFKAMAAEKDGMGPSEEERLRLLGELPWGGGPPPHVRRMLLKQPKEVEVEEAKRAVLRGLAAASPAELLGIAASVSSGPSASDGGGQADAVSRAVAAASASKDSGNEHFRAGRYGDALELYRTAAVQLLAALPAAVLLSNLAACWLQLSDPRGALQAAGAAAALDRGNAKAHHRRAQALLQLGWLAEAEEACALGIKEVGGGGQQGGEGGDGMVAALRELAERVRLARRVQEGEEEERRKAEERRRGEGQGQQRGGRGGVARGGGTGEDEPSRHLSEREVHEMKMPNSTAEQDSMFNMMKQMMASNPAMSKRLRREQPLMWASMQRDERIPPLHKEVEGAESLPVGTDEVEARQRLWQAHELCVGMAAHLLGMAIPGGVDPMDVIHKRVGFIGHPEAVRQRVHWLTAAPPGAVDFRSSSCRSTQGYNPTIFHSFCNAHSPAIPMTPPPSLPPTQPVPGAASGGGGGDGDATIGCGGGSGAAAAGRPYVHVAVGFVDFSTLAAAVGLPVWDEHVREAMREEEAEEAGTAVEGVGREGSHRQRRQGPLLLRWVGCEASPYSVAKALVLQRMMRRGAAAADHVMQVWYSSTWTTDAHAAFRRALSELLADHTEAVEAAAAAGAKPGAGGGAGAGGGGSRRRLAPAVLPYLRHWQQRDVGLAEARRKWMEDRKSTLCDVGHFAKKSDRLAVASYLLTGQLPGLGLNGPTPGGGRGSRAAGAAAGSGGGAGGLVGSVVMFAVPPGGAERSLDEDFMQGIPPHELLEARLPSAQQLNEQQEKQPPATSTTAAAARSSTGVQGKRRGGGGKAGQAAAAGVAAQQQQPGEPSHPPPPPDVVSGGVALLRRRVQRLASLVATGRVGIQVELREVGPADRAAHDHLASLRPDSISWSNVPDYMEPAGFHAMARACSAPAAPPPAPSAAASSSSTKSNSKGGSSSCSGNGGRGGGKPTRHYLHSMNWVMDVKGACHLDELMPYIYGQGGTAGRRGGGRQGRGEVNEEAGKRVMDMVDAGTRAVRRQYGTWPARQRALLLDPPVDNPRNIADFGLQEQHYMAWVRAFLAAGALPQSALSAAVTSPPVYFPLARTTSTISLAFSYGDA